MHITADRLEQLRQGAHAEPALAVIALDNVCRLAIVELRQREQGATVTPIRPLAAVNPDEGLVM